MAANARHSKANPDWQTPEEDVELARTVLGGTIELDPFSCESANARIRATRFFTKEQDGFVQDWTSETTFINHPGGTTKKSWAKLCKEYRARHVKKFVWVGFSIEQLAVLAVPYPRVSYLERLAGGFYVPTDFSNVFLRRRIHFIDANDPNRPDRPGHANFICIGGVSPKEIERVYGHKGQFTHGAMAVSKLIGLLETEQK